MADYLLRVNEQSPRLTTRAGHIRVSSQPHGALLSFREQNRRPTKMISRVMKTAEIATSVAPMFCSK